MWCPEKIPEIIAIGPNEEIAPPSLSQVPSYINGEAKMLVLAFNSVTPAPEFPYGAFVPMVAAFTAIYVMKKLLKR